MRDLTLLDATLARLAAALQMDVADHDTGRRSSELGTSSYSTPRACGE
jgi:hypothetical protein